MTNIELRFWNKSVEHSVWVFLLSNFWFNKIEISKWETSEKMIYEMKNRTMNLSNGFAIWLQIKRDPCCDWSPVRLVFRLWVAERCLLSLALIRSVLVPTCVALRLFVYRCLRPRCIRVHEVRVSVGSLLHDPCTPSMLHSFTEVLFHIHVFFFISHHFLV